MCLRKIRIITFFKIQIKSIYIYIKFPSQQRKIMKGLVTKCKSERDLEKQRKQIR